MEEYSQNPLCENKAIKEVPVSVHTPSDQVRALCAACEEVYTWGVQHGSTICEGLKIDPPPKEKGDEALFRVVYIMACYPIIGPVFMRGFMMRPLKITCQITTKQISNLVRTENDGRVRQRLRAMKFISQGQTIPQVARRMDISERPLRKWIHRFNKEGPKGLYQIDKMNFQIYVYFLG